MPFHATGLVLLPFIFALLWKQRREIARAWLHRHMFGPALYWGIAALYAASGALVTFAAFGSVHLDIDVRGVAMQVLGGVGIIAIGIAWLIARHLATPIFEVHAVAHADRTAIHSLWSAFWLPGLVIGFLPALF